MYSEKESRSIDLYSDEAIHRTLADVQMLKAVESLSKEIKSQVSDQRTDLTSVLDEPTTNVDTHADQLLQDAVKKSFTKML